MSTSCRVAIIGCGVIAPTHAECFQREANADVRWACDTVESRAQALAQKFSIPRVTTRLEEVLADPEVDAISICTPHADHASIAIAALDAGKHVLCEKALAPTHAHMDAMLAAGDRHPDRVFSGVFQHRFDRRHQVLKRLVESGAFGDMLTAGMHMRCYRSKAYYRADAWRGTWDREGGSVLINQAIHTVDILAWICGGVASLCGTYDNQTHADTIETEDVAVATLRFRNGALGTIEATSSSPLDWENTLFVHGTAGSLELRNQQPMKVSFTDPAVTEAVRADLTRPIEPAAPSSAKAYYGGEHRSQIADFVAAVIEHRAPFITARSARHAVDIVLGVYESHRTGGWIQL